MGTKKNKIHTNIKYIDLTTVCDFILNTFKVNKVLQIFYIK